MHSTWLFWGSGVGENFRRGNQSSPNDGPFHFRSRWSFLPSESPLKMEFVHWMLKSIRVDARLLFPLHRAVLCYFFFFNLVSYLPRSCLGLKLLTVKSGLFLIFYVFLSNGFQTSCVGISDSHIKGDVFWWSLGTLLGLCPEGLKKKSKEMFWFWRLADF